MTPLVAQDLWRVDGGLEVWGKGFSPWDREGPRDVGWSFYRSEPWIASVS